MLEEAGIVYKDTFFFFFLRIRGIYVDDMGKIRRKEPELREKK